MLDYYLDREENNFFSEAAVNKNDKEKRIAKFTSEERKYYDALMHVRDMVSGSLKSHAADALDCSNADKRGVTTHMADMGSDNSRHEMELQLMTAEGDVLDLIDDALQRLFDGDYGKCHECGEKSPPARLDVRPYAIYCVKCKSRLEQHGRI